MFGRDWEPTTATIVMARVRGVGGKTGMKSIFEFEADVLALDGGEAFRAELDDPHEPGFRPPGEGISSACRCCSVPRRCIVLSG